MTHIEGSTNGLRYAGMVMAACVSSDFRDAGAAGLDVTGPGAAGAGIFCAAGAIGPASG